MEGKLKRFNIFLIMVLQNERNGGGYKYEYREKIVTEEIMAKN